MNQANPIMSVLLNFTGNSIGNSFVSSQFFEPPNSDFGQGYWSSIDSEGNMVTITSSQLSSASPASSSPSPNYASSHYSNLAASINSFEVNPKTRNTFGPGNVMVDDNANWDGLFQLIGLSLVSTLGTMGGIFVISAITVIDTFQARGNVYLVSLSLSHLLVTILVIPASCVAIMANVPDNPSVCHFQWLITLSTLIISVLSFMFMSIENLKGLTSPVTYDLCCTKFKIVTIVLIIWIAGIAFPIGQHLNGYGPSICKTDLKAYAKINFTYHASICGAFLALPTLITLLCFTRCFFIMKFLKSQLEANPTEDPWAYMITDESLLKSNIWIYLSSFFMWTPLTIVCIVNLYRPIAQEWLNTCWYIALTNSCAYSFLYAATNRDFAEAFFKLFYYCCCKSHVSWTRKGGGLRRGTAGDAVGLRVHIIPGLNMYSQRRDCSVPVSTRITAGGSGSGGHSSGFAFGVGHSSGHAIGGASCSSGPFARSFQSRAYKTSGDL